jgi:DNA polymerase III epsilon subunit-like protein
MNNLGKILFLDTETVSNQGDSYFDRKENQNDLIQISFVDLFNNEYDRTIRPYKTYHYTTDWYKDHRIVWDMVKDMEELPNYYLELKQMLEGRTIVCHNVKFDRNVIYQSLKNYDLQMFQNINWVDSKQIYADYFGITNRSYSKLERLAKQIGVYDELAHNSLIDAKMLRSVFMNMVRMNMVQV